jgi:hypothetical protein
VQYAEGGKIRGRRYSREDLCHGRITTGGKWGVVVFEEARVAQLQWLGGYEHLSRDRIWLEYESKPRDRGWGDTEHAYK